MAAIGGISFAAGTVFLMLGAWPVFGFFGLDVLLVYWAFRANYRAAAAHEEVTVTASELRVRRVSHRGKVSEWKVNPLWVKLDRENHEEFGIEHLFLVSRGQRLAVASFWGRRRRKASRRRSEPRLPRPSAARPERCLNKLGSKSSVACVCDLLAEIGWRAVGCPA